VKRRLEGAGLWVIPQYSTSGFGIDFGICHPEQPGRFPLAVEADGASYHSSKTARDRDRLRQDVLERLGWRFHRIWSTDWFNDREAEMERLLAVYQDELKRLPRAAARERLTRADAEPTPARAARSGPRPRIRRGLGINDYSREELVALACWIAPDTLLRTADEMLTEMMSELGFQKRGKRIVAALTAATAPRG
jgi:very-short-patch-repair endonuclease